MIYREPPRILILDASQPLAQAMQTYTLMALAWQRPPVPLGVWGWSCCLGPWSTIHLN